MSKGHLSTVVWHLRRLVGAPYAGESTDAQLLARFATQRDETAFALLVQRHGPMVLSVCRRVLHDAHDADDAFQATFIVLVRKAASIRRPELLGNWLYGVAYRTASKAKVSAARRHACERQVQAMPPAEVSSLVDERELRAVLDEELDRLPEKYRAPLVLCYLEGKTNEEAAQELHWTKGTVSGRLARARDLLRGRLTRRGLVLSVSLLASVLSQNAAPAAVPVALADATVKAALLHAAGSATLAGALSAPAALAEGVLKSMFLTKMKIVAGVVLALGAAGLSTGVVTHQVLVAQETQQQQIEAARAAVLDDNKAKEDRDKQVKDNPSVADLQKENARLRKELEALRKEIATAKEQTAQERERAELLRQEAERALQEARAQAVRARQAAEEANRAKEAGAREEAKRNLKRLGIALHNYHVANGSFPPAVVYSKDGKPLYSWRVLLLPYLEEDDLYKGFNLDQPWDSEQNKKLLDKMPKVFAPVLGGKKDASATPYQVFVGTGTAFDGKEGLKVSDFTDGTSNTLLLVEGETAVSWTKPDDLAYDADKPLPKLGGYFPDGFHALFADGSVHFLKKDIKEETLRALITRNGAEVVKIPN